MRHHAYEHIVEDGPERLRETAQCLDAARAIEARFGDAYRRRAVGRSAVGRCVLRLRLWREKRKALDAIAPPDACHATDASRGAGR